MSRLTGFEIQAPDPAREIRVGAGLHGWTFDGLGEDGRLIPNRRSGARNRWRADAAPRRPLANGQPGGAHPCVVSVDDVDDAVAKVPGMGAARSSSRRSRCRASAGARTRATRDATGSA
jgi:hypothetical protein